MEKLSKELLEHILFKSFLSSHTISGVKRALQQEQKNKDEFGFTSTSTQVAINYQTVTSIHDQTTYIVLMSVCADWRQVLVSVSQTTIIKIRSLRSNIALALSNLGK